MLLRLINPSRGSVFEPGQIIRIGDKEARNLIAEGVAEAADESEVQKFEAPTPQPRQHRGGGNPFLSPPIFLCGCGFVAANAEELAEHRASCD